MAREHASAAKNIPGSVIRCGPRRMLQHICERCGSGQPFKTKGGKVITMPEGVYQCTDKEMMKVLGTNRRETVRENRRSMVKALQGSVTIDREFKQGCRYPVLVYRVDLLKMAEIAHHNYPKSVQSKWTETDQSKLKGWTETAAHTGDLRLMGRTASPEAGEDGANGVGSADAAQASLRCAPLRSDSADAFTPTDKKHQKLVSELQDFREWLIEAGYESGTEKDLTRIYRVLESKWDEFVDVQENFGPLFEEYLPKAKWLLNKTQGRVAWLADRFESKSERSLLNQYRAFLEGRKRFEPEVLDDTLDSTPAADSPAARRKKFTMNTCEPGCGRGEGHHGECFPASMMEEV